MEAKKLSAADFNFLGILGRGAYGRVAKAQKKDTGDYFAIKIVEKSHLQRVNPNQEGKTSQALIEKNILAKLRNHPGTVRLFYTFQDQESLYYVLEYCPNGDFLSLISSFSNRLPLPLAKFYTAELIYILQVMFDLGVVHRDLKPENLLISGSYHLRLSDFGTAKDLNNTGTRDRSHTFVGTAEYVSPEVLGDQEAGVGVDLWALGCVVYQMLVGRPPFQGMSQYLIFEQIRQGNVNFPEDIDADGRDLIEKLLVQDPALRLGAGEQDLAALKAHPFVRGLDIENILNEQVPWSDWPSRKMKDSEEEGEDDDEDLEVRLLNMKNEEVKAQEPAVMVAGIIKKKCGWFYKKRYLVVSSQPRIYYTDANNSQNIREIVLSKNLKAELRAGKDFVINNPIRSYYFRETVGNPQRWVDSINKVIADNFQ